MTKHKTAPLLPLCSVAIMLCRETKFLFVWPKWNQRVCVVIAGFVLQIKTVQIYFYLAATKYERDIYLRVISLGLIYFHTPNYLGSNFHFKCKTQQQKHEHVG